MDGESRRKGSERKRKGGSRGVGEEKREEERGKKKHLYKHKEGKDASAEVVSCIC